MLLTIVACVDVLLRWRYVIFVLWARHYVTVACSRKAIRGHKTTKIPDGLKPAFVIFDIQALKLKYCVPLLLFYKACCKRKQKLTDAMTVVR